MNSSDIKSLIDLLEIFAVWDKNTSLAFQDRQYIHYLCEEVLMFRPVLNKEEV